MTVDIDPLRTGATAGTSPKSGPIPSGASPRRVSMVDVASHAGVSIQTVSRVTNGSADVRGSTRQQVIAAMKELGYRPNSAARALKRGSFRTIGILAFLCPPSAP